LRELPFYDSKVPNADHLHDLPILTKTISKVTLPQNMVIRRGVNDFKIGELGYDSLDKLKIGDVFTDKAFISSSMHRSTGFFREYDLIIVAPKGAQGVFAEPFSHYTDNYKFQYNNDTNKANLWNGKSKETIKGEFEWIGQRGGKFKVLEKQGKTIYLQLIGQLQ
jgi:hypothetical protein